MNIKHKPILLHNQQKGVSLIISMILLIVLTMLSLAAARSSNLDTKIASNHQHKQLAFQAAENTFARLLTSSPSSTTLPGTIGAVVNTNNYIAESSAAHNHADLSLTLIDTDAPGLLHGNSVSGKIILYTADATGCVTATGASSCSGATTKSSNRMEVILVR